MEAHAILKMVWEDEDFKDAVVEGGDADEDNGLIRIDIRVPNKQALLSFDPNSNDERYLQVLASLLAGREIEAEKTNDGKYIALYMRFDRPPPPKEDTPVGALRSFILMMLRDKAKERTMGADRLSKGDTDGDHTGPSRGSD